MDFNLILLLASVGLLVMVAIFAVLGFFGGLKRELICTAIAVVLLILTLLVFGDSSALLNANGEALKSILKGIPDSAHTVWECVLGFARSSVQNGDQIFAEGSESYNFLYNVVSCVARGVALIAGVLVALIVILLVNIIYRIVARARAKKHAHDAPEADKPLQDNVIVTGNEQGNKGAVIKTGTSETGEVKESKHRGWGALLAAVRAIIIIFILFMPIGGISSVLDEATPETKQLMKDVLNGDTKKTSQTDDLVDMAFEFTDAYQASIIGKIVESPKYFFGESLSNKLFDSAFVVKSDNGNYPLRGEVVTLLRAINALEGNIDTKSLTQEEVNNAVDALKDSNLIVDLMPVVIEFAYYTPIKDNQIFKGKTLGDLLFVANQQAAFLALRQEDWKANIDAILETVKSAYALGVLKSDFNYLTMDTKILGEAADHLTDATAINKLLNILILTAVNHDLFTSKVGPLPSNPDLSDFDWKKEMADLVNMYDTFKGLGITTFENVDMNQLITDILNDDAKFDIVADILEQFTSIQIFNKILIPVAITYASNQDAIKDAGMEQAVKDLANANWKGDVVKYLEAFKIALNEELVKIGDGLKIEADYFHFDPDALREVKDKLFETDTFEKVLPIAANIALGMDVVKNLIGDRQVNIDTSKIDWESDFTTLIDIYEEFLDFGVNEMADITDSPMDFLKGILADDTKSETLENIAGMLPELSLFLEVAAPIGNEVLNQKIAEALPEIADVINLNDLSKEDWKEDLENLVKVAESVYDATEFDFDLKSLEFNQELSDAAVDAIDKALSLHLLGDDDTKTQLLNGVLNHFNVFDEEVALEELDWESEKEALKGIVAEVINILSYEEIDLGNLSGTDYEALLTNEEFLDDVVTTLEALIESKIVLDLLPAAIDKYVLPRVEKIDDDNVVKDITDHLTSEELIVEVEKLVDVIKAIVKINVLKYKSEGLNAIKWEETEAFHTIINGIMDSKLIEGYEGRIIRIILVATKLFPDLEKGVFDGVDFDGEQAILNKVIDDLEPLMKDERFAKVNNETNKFIFYTDLYLSDVATTAIKNALDDLFGTWDPEAGETAGSGLIAAMLPEVVNKFVARLEEPLSEIIDIAGLLEETGEELASDVKHIAYIVKVVIDNDAQNYILDNDYDFGGSAKAIGKVLDAIMDMHCVAGKENALVAWAVNFAIDKTSLNIDHVTADTFADVDWPTEIAAIKQLIADVIEFTVYNEISTVKKLQSFIQEKRYTDKALITKENAESLLTIATDLVALKTIDNLLPSALAYALHMAEEKGFDFGFLKEGMTAELLTEDVLSLIDAARIAVRDMDIVDMYKSDWNTPLPAIEHVTAILDKVVNLNLLAGDFNELINKLIEKFLPANDYVTAADLKVTDEYDFLADWPVIKDALAEAYRFFPVNNMDTVKEAIDFFKNKDFKVANLVTVDNLMLAADVLEVLSNAVIAQEALQGALKVLAGNEKVTQYGDFDSLKEYTKEEAQQDLCGIADIIRLGAPVIVEFYTTKDLDPIDFETIAQVVEALPGLTLVNKYLGLIAPSVLNGFVKDKIGDKFPVSHEFTPEDFAGIDWTNECNIFADMIRQAGDILLPLNVDSIADIKQFIANQDFLDKRVATEENADKVINLLELASESKLIEIGMYYGIDFAINFATTKGYDVTFLSGVYTPELLMDDLYTIVQMLKEAVAFGAIDYYQNGDFDGFDVEHIANIVAMLEDLNILTVNDVQPDWALLIAKVAAFNLDSAKYSELSRADFEGIDYAHENLILQDVVREAGKLLAAENLESIEEIKNYISNKYYTDINAYNDDALDAVQNIIDLAADSHIVAMVLPFALDFAISKVTFLDLSFLKDRFEGSELAHDLGVLNDIITDAREFGIVHVIFYREVEDEINLDPIIDAVSRLEDLNILTKDDINRNWAALAVNFAAKQLKFDLQVKPEDFENIVFADENALLVKALQDVKYLLKEVEIKKLSDINPFLSEKKYLQQELYTLEVLDYLDDIVDQVVASKLVQVVLPPLFDYAVEWFSVRIADFAYLEGKLTGEELANDIRVLADDAIFLVQTAKILDVYNNKLVPEYTPSYIAAIVKSFEKMNVMKVDQVEMTVLLTNYVAEKVLKMEGRVHASDFANITDWAAENAAIVAALRELQDVFSGFVADQGITTWEDAKNFPAKLKEDLSIIDDQLVLDLADVLEALSDSLLVGDEGVFFMDFALDRVTALDLSFLKGLLAGEELASDLGVLAEIVRDAVHFGALEIAFKNQLSGEIQVDYLIDAVSLLEELNLLTKNDVNRNWAALAVNFGAKQLKLDIEAKPEDFENIVFADENALLVKALVDVKNLMSELDITTVNKIKAFIEDKTYMTQDIYTLEVLDYLDDLVDQVVASGIVQVVLPPLFDYAVEWFSVRVIDFAYLEGKLTGAEIANDIRVLADDAIFLLQTAKILDVYNNKLVPEYTPSYIAAIVKSFEKMNVMKVDQVEMTVLLTNYVAEKVLKMEGRVHASDFANITDWAAENAAIVNALRELQDVFSGFVADQGITTWEDAKNFPAKLKEDLSIIDDQLVLDLADVLEALSDSLLVGDEGVFFMDFALDKVTKFDLSFLKGLLVGEELASDLGVVAEIARDAVHFGALEIAFKNQLSGEIQVDYLIDAVSLLEELNLLTKNDVNRNWAALATNYAATMLKIDFEAKPEDFENIVFADENALLCNALVDVKNLMSELDINTVKKIKAFLEDKTYMTQDIYTLEVLDYLDDLVDQVVASGIVKFALPPLFDYGVDFISNKIVDLSYLKGQLNGDELANDVRVLADDAIFLLQTAKILDVYNNKTLPEYTPSYLAAIVKSFEKMNVMKVDQVQMTTILTNFVVEKVLKIEERVDATDFVDITDWAAENEAMVKVLAAVQQIFSGFFVDNDITTLEAAKGIVNLIKNDTSLITDELMLAVADVLAALSESKLACCEGVFGLRIAINYMEKQGYDISKALVTAPELSEDLLTISDVIKSTIHANLVGFGFRTEKINQEHFAEFQDAIERAINLNILKGEGVREALFSFGFNKVGIEVTADELAGIDWEGEAEIIADLLGVLNEATIKLDRLTLGQIVALKDHYKEYLKLEEKTNDYLESIADALALIAESELVERVALKVSAKFLTAEKLAGLVDLHNIYEDGAELQEDLADLSAVVYSVINLDLYNCIVTGDKDYPWDQLDDIRTIITYVFGLNYLNKPGRVDALLAKVPNYDLSDIDGDEIDLAGDGELIYQAYLNLSKFTTHPNFWLQNKADLTDMRIVIKDWIAPEFKYALRSAVHNILDTTIVDKTNGLILVIIAAPFIKAHFADIYEALEIERLTADDWREDFDAIVELFDEACNLDFEDILDGNYFRSSVGDFAVDAIEKLRNLNLLADHGNALANAILARLDGKIIMGHAIDKDEYDLDSVDFYSDAGVLKEIITTAYTFFGNNDIITLKDLMNFLKNMKLETVITRDNLDSIEELAQEILDLTLVKYNALVLYNTFGEEQIVKLNAKLTDLAHIADIYSTSEELHDDLQLLLNVIIDLDNFGIIDIVNGGQIDFGNQVVIDDLFDNLAEIKYLNERISDIVAFLDEILKDVDLSVLEAENIDWDADVQVLKEIYDVLIPALISVRNPIHTIEDVKNISTLKVQKGFIYDYQSEYADAVELFAEITIAPQIVKFIANMVSSKLSGVPAELVDILDIANEDNDALREDIVTLAEVLRDAKAVDVLNYVLYRNNISIDNYEDYSKLAADLFVLHMLDDNMEELVRFAFNKLNVDLSNVDLSTIDWEAEQASVVLLVSEALQSLISADIHSFSGIGNYIRSNARSISAGIKSSAQLFRQTHFKAAARKLIDTICNVTKELDGEMIVATISTALDLQLAAKVIIPVYEQLLYAKFNDMMKLVGDIHDYSEDQLTTDLGLLKTFINKLFESNIHRVFTDRELDNSAEAVAALEDAVRAILSLELLDIKIQDFGPILAKIPAVRNFCRTQLGLDLATYTGAGISFKLDADQYANMVSPLYAILQGYIDKGANGAFFGETDAIRGFVDIYELSVDTTLGAELYHYLLEFARLMGSKANMAVNPDDQLILHDLAVLMEGTLDLGVFSNNGIDLTMTATINAMRSALYEIVRLPRNLTNRLNFVINRLDAYGLVPYSWEQVSLSNEFSVVRTLVKQINSLRSNYSVTDLKFLTSLSAQADMTEIVRTVFDSTIISQLVFPFIDGTFRLLMRDQYNGDMEYTATLDDIIDYVLPDLWTIIGDLDEICGLDLSASFDLTKFSAYAELIDVIFSDILLKDNIDAFIIVAIGKFANYPLDTDKRAALGAIDYDLEGNYYAGFFTTLQEWYDVKPFSVETTGLSESAYRALSHAIKAIVPSQILATVGTDLLAILNNKFIAEHLPDLSEKITTKLGDGTYGNVEFVEDLATLAELFGDIYEANMLTNSTDFAEWNFDYARETISDLFALHLLEGHEKDIIESIFERIPYIKDNYDENTMIVNDWENELIQIVNTLEQVVLAGFDTIDTPVDDLGGHGAIILAAMQSVILRNVFLDNINSNLANNGVASYQVTMSDLYAVDTVEGWNTEIDCMQQSIDLVQGLNDGTLNPTNPVDFAHISAVYNTVKSTSYIANKVLEAALADAGIDTSMF